MSVRYLPYSLMISVSFWKFFNFIVTGRDSPASKRQNIKNNVMENGEIIIPVFGIMLPIIITLGAFVMIVYIRKFSNIERMAIIDKGLSPDLFKKESSASGTLRAALLLIGIGIGFLMGVWLDRVFDLEEVGYFSMLFIFGGLGLGMAYLIEEKKAKTKTN